jgi:hypothetical protein
MKLPSADEGKADSIKNYRFFGGIFQLAKEKSCEIQVEIDTNSGKCLIILSKKIDIQRKKMSMMLEGGDEKWAWWEGSVEIKIYPIGKNKE